MRGVFDEVNTTFFSEYLYKRIYCEYSFESPQEVPTLVKLLYRTG